MLSEVSCSLSSEKADGSMSIFGYPSRKHARAGGDAEVRGRVDKLEDVMFDKYEDYPNGISRNAILNASIAQLSRILEIEVAEYRDVIGLCLGSSTEFESSLNRLSIIGQLLEITLSNWDNNDFSRDAIATQASIYTGSMLEGSLQFFLLCFQEDFNESNWKNWKDKKTEDFEAVQKHIDDSISELVTDGLLLKKQGESLRKVIKFELKMRQNGRSIERIMLDELKSLLKKFNILQTGFKAECNPNDEPEPIDQLIKRIDSIQKARNGIHIFSKCEIPTPEDAINHVRDLCLIMKDLLFRVRCINNDTRMQAIYEALLEIPGVTLMELNDNGDPISIRQSTDGR